MRVVFVSALVLAVCSCNTRPQPSEPVPSLPETTTPETPAPVLSPSNVRRIAIGDSASEAHERILSSGGSVMVGVGFLYLGAGRQSWYELKDGTCLCVTFDHPTEANGEVVRKLFLGEQGQGLGDKTAYLAKKPRDVTAVDLP